MSSTEKQVEEGAGVSVQALKERIQGILARPALTRRDAEEAAEIARLIADVVAVSERAAALLGRSDEEVGESLAGRTLDDAAEIVLRRVGHPLHGRELGATIKAAGWRHPRSSVARPDQIIYQLAARLPKDERFERVAPNTFGLREWSTGDRTGRGGPPRLRTFKGPAGPFAVSTTEHDPEIHESERSTWGS
jgi:HB1, ASXL, restriction endonuclease HTH domain